MCRTAASCLCPRRSHDTSLLWLSEKLSLRHSQSKCSRWISVGSQRTCQIPTCRRPSFDLSMDPPCGARDLATFGTALEQHRHVGPNRVQVQHRGGVPNYPSNGIRFWWYLHLALELKFIFECPDHATHQSHCSLGQSILSMTTERNCDLSGFGSCPSCISYCCGDLHHCWFSIAFVWSPVSSPARPPTLPSFSTASLSVNGECKDHYCSSILRDQHRRGISAQITTLNHRALDASEVDVEDLNQPHNDCTNLGRACETPHHGVANMAGASHDGCN